MTLIEKLEKVHTEYDNDFRITGNRFSDAFANGIEQAIDIVKQHSDWVLCSERLPNENTSVLIYDESLNKKKAISTGVLIFGKFVTYPSFLETLNVTHWQPLPQPPSEV